VTPTESIIKFNSDRNLTSFDGASELAMIQEEFNELADAIAADDSYEIIDALNDLRVLTVGALWKLGQDPDLSLAQTCKEILSRQGSIGPNGKWLKDLDQDPSTLYKADYSLSRRKLS